MTIERMNIWEPAMEAVSKGIWDKDNLGPLVGVRCRVCNQWVPPGMPIRCRCDAPDETALATQIGGTHYKDMAIQPAEFIHKNSIGFLEGCAIKYLCRWRTKGGIEDLKKAKHFIDILIALERCKEPA